MERLKRTQPDQLIDFLNERLTFERSGVRLYDRILEKIQADSDSSIRGLFKDMKNHRDEEKEHEEWLEDQIRSLGGDAHGETDRSRLVTQESQGIETVVLHSDATVPHLFHALLAAELVDNAGWDLLLQIADEMGEKALKREFRRRLNEEEDHLRFVRRVVEKLSVAQVKGTEAQL